MNDETLEIIGMAIYMRQRDAIKTQDSVNARRPWRSPDVPAAFWDGFVQDARAAIDKYTELRNFDMRHLLYSSGEER